MSTEYAPLLGHEENVTQYYTGDIESLDLAELKIVLVGRTGSGKSATGNTIIGKKAFTVERSLNSVTRECRTERFEFEGKLYTVIDTPGVFGTHSSAEKIEKELSKVMSDVGPYVFLLVWNLRTAFNTDEKKAINWIFEQFGETAIEHTIILYTNLDCLKDKSLEELVSTSEWMVKMITMCGGRICGFENTQSDNGKQVTDLMKKIREMLDENRRNGIRPYTEASYRETQEENTTHRNIEMFKDIMLKIAIVIGIVTGAAGGASFILARWPELMSVSVIAAGGLMALGAAIGCLARSIKQNREKETNPYGTYMEFFD